MSYLLLCILSSTLILIVFRLLDKLRVSTLNAIIVNYFTASTLGYLTGRNEGVSPFAGDWFYTALITGFLFVFMFFAIGYSARVAGITITSLMTKLSVVIPVAYSIVFFGEEITMLKIAGMILALASITMIVHKPRKDTGNSKETGILIWLPVILFLGAGFIDSLIKYSQEVLVPEKHTLAFSTTTFMAAAVTSVLFRLTGKFGKNEDRWYRVAAGGIALGVVNFGSLYFLIMALESPRMDSSLVFGINNLGVVLLSVLSGMLFFGEKTTLLNRIGILTANISILILFLS
jgi:drug/metabolite transporter (DMT)-like permease